MEDFSAGEIEIPEVPEIPEIIETPEIQEAVDASMDGGDIPESSDVPQMQDVGESEFNDEQEKIEPSTPDEVPLDAQNDATLPDADSGANEPADTDLSDEVIKPESEVQPEELESNSKYERNGYEYKTDDFGRTERVSGTLELEQGPRTKLQTEIGHQGLESDEGGHLVGSRFNGPTDAFNLVPQDANLNRGEWKSMENSWAKALESGSDVKVLVEPAYSDDSIRPESFEVVSQIDGDLSYTSFVNQASNDGTKETTNG